ncbi:hypothetical protein DL766_001707 [Monosporascus sp. MC13-8B]|uniref:Urease accessory protein UreD n=1 Tax=Monosporascus cannonballus TaxID=155416 RepID=A0ABY0GT92_9PEZI|nr:hypothetical protein DL762_009780 [Monosporascus cannonballus]RYP36950.1 hypothetical protein DL766_001707 [Monosporascus sp. MC13-8B]
MPHKHTRREKDPSTFDLPPSQFARPLPVRQELQKNASSKKGATVSEKKLKRKRDGNKADDAPRAFKRLMAYASGKKPRSGLDNGEEMPGKSKKRKVAQTAASEGEANETPGTPKIRPGERMSDFVARVDAALPISGLVNKSVRDGKDPLNLKVWRTNKERKMHKLYDQWREEERKIKEKKEEELELQAERELEEEEAGVSWKIEMQNGASGKKKKKKGKKTKYLGEVDDAEDDPWEALKKKRGETRAGLHDVVQAPPELAIKPQKKMTVRGAAVEVDDIPKAAGSLRRREELQTIRNDVVASYRKMMSEKRPAL